MTNDSSTPNPLGEHLDQVIEGLANAPTKEEQRLYMRALVRALEYSNRKSAKALAALVVALSLIVGCGDAGPSAPSVTGQDAASEAAPDAPPCSSEGVAPDACPGGTWTVLYTGCAENPDESKCLATPAKSGRFCCEP
jgi:hypothetical protein